MSIVQCKGSPCFQDCRGGRDCSEQQPKVIRNQGVETVWFPRRADLSLAESECSAGPGDYYALGKPPRIPRAMVNLWPLAGFCAIVFGIPGAWWLVATIARAMP